MPQCDPRARGSPKARKLLNRPALRGGVIQPGAYLTPGFYPAPKSNVWIALGGPGLPFRNSGLQEADTAFHGPEGHGCCHPPGRAAKALGEADTGETAGGPLRWCGTAL